MQRAPVMLSFLWVVALCASLAYWLLQWFAPEPRAVAAPPESARAVPPVAAASALFGGRAQDPGGAAVQLRGILLAGRASVAIISAEGKPARALPVSAEVMPGLTVQKIAARTVVLSGRGAERELTLPAFAAQEGGTAGAQTGAAPEPQAIPVQPPSQAPQSAPQPAPSPPQVLQPQPVPSSSSGASDGGSSASGGAPAASALPSREAPGARPAGAAVMLPNRPAASLPEHAPQPMPRAPAPR